MTKFLDISGDRCGMLTVVSLHDRSPRTSWLCRCDCGNEVVIQGNNLRSGNSKSCGCTRPEVSKELWRSNRDRMHLPRPLIDITGRRFGHLIALSLVHAATTEEPRTTWLLACDCGQTTVAESYHLRTGSTRSCGCRRYEMMSDANSTHGHTRGGSHSPEYRSWTAMRTRCSNPSHDAYPYYGGRGIAVCAQWQGSFATFLADMGLKPTPKHTIDRKDPDGNYEPGNCRWATWKEQQQTRRKAA